MKLKGPQNPDTPLLLLPHGAGGGEEEQAFSSDPEGSGTEGRKSGLPGTVEHVDDREDTSEKVEAHSRLFL